MEEKTFLGTIHPHSYGTKMADGVNCITQSYLFKTNFNANAIREQKSSYNDLASFCHDFQGMWEEDLTLVSEFIHEGESEKTMQWYDQECYGKLTLSDEGVRLYRNEDGWTMLVALDLNDLTPFKVYKAIGRCLRFMEDFPARKHQGKEYWEDDLIDRAERKYKEWLEKKESDIINNNKDDQDFPF